MRRLFVVAVLAVLAALACDSWDFDATQPLLLADLTIVAAALFCQRCHGVDAASGGSVPDLRFLQTSTHASLERIVRGGARRQFGMPSFADDLTPEQVRTIHA